MSALLITVNVIGPVSGMVISACLFDCRGEYPNKPQI